jgi:endonuclease YncB( thermonuclease family)
VANRLRTNVLKALIIFISVLFLLFWPLKIKAEELPVQPPSVIFNEINWAGSSKSSDDEWIELKNTTPEKINISGWQFVRYKDDNELSTFKFPDPTFIEAGAYLILTHFDKGDSRTVLNLENINYYIVYKSLSLVNKNLELKLFDSQNNLVDLIIYTEPFAGLNINDNDKTNDKDEALKSSMERISQITDGSQPSAWYTAFSSQNLIATGHDFGTPGTENSYKIFDDKLPFSDEFSQYLSEYLDLTNAFVLSAKIESAIDGDTIRITTSVQLPPDTTVRLLGIDCPETGTFLAKEAREFWDDYKDKEVTLILKPPFIDGDFRFLAIVVFQDEILNLSLLREGLAKRFQAVNTLILDEEWNKIENEAKNIYKGIWASYKKGNVIISEVLPDPVGEDSDLEWIELQNLSNFPIDLSFWILDKKTRFTIPFGTIIPPKGFLVFYRPETKITLANEDDSLDLYFPDGNLADLISYSNAPEGQSWARGEDGNFYWTVNPTPGIANQIVAEVKKEKNKKEEVASEPINQGSGEEAPAQTIIIKKVIIVTTTIPPPQTNLVPISSIILGAQSSRPLPSFQNWLFIILLIFTGAFLYLTGDFVWQKYILQKVPTKPKIWPPT